MRIYLDTCSLQRPLDSRTQIRIILEAEVVLGILTLCEEGRVDLVGSDALLFETQRNPNPARQAYALDVLSKVRCFVALNDSVERRAKELNALGVGALDALHLASAEEAHADFFCTCDDQLLRATRAIQALQVKVIAPLDLAEELEG